MGGWVSLEDTDIEKSAETTLEKNTQIDSRGQDEHEGLWRKETPDMDDR